MQKAMILTVNPPCELSRRETEVLRMLAEDIPRQQIALRMGLSVRTVETYLLNCSRKLGIHTQIGLVRYAIKKGLVSL